MTSPTTYRIADKAPVFPCWIYGSEFGWVRGYEDEPINDDETHWCHSEDRPTHDPTAPASPASSAAKGGDIPRTPTDSEMMNALRGLTDSMKRLRDSGHPYCGPMLLEQAEAAIAAAMQKGVRG